jgi:hypothetical protein
LSRRNEVLIISAQQYGCAGGAAGLDIRRKCAGKPLHALLGAVMTQSGVRSMHVHGSASP